MKKSELLYFKTWNSLVEKKIHSKLVILGSSRAKVQFSPKAIDSVFNLNSCNLGMEGTGFNLQYTRFQFLMEGNELPKYIIQNIDCYSTLQNNIFQVEQYIPYLNNEIIKRATLKNEVFNNLDYYLPLYKYTHSLFTKEIIKDGLTRLVKRKVNENISIDNFKINTEPWNPTAFEILKKDNPNGIRFTLDSSSLNLFKTFLIECNSRKIKVILVYAPEYIELQKLILNRDSIVSIYKNYSIKYGTAFLDYSNDSICLNKNNFYNAMHLNACGVEKFNSKLISDLKEVIK